MIFPMWLLWLTLAFATLVLLSLLLNYTNLGRRIVRRYPKVFEQPWEDRQTELLKFIEIEWKAPPMEYTLHLQDDQGELYRIVKGRPITTKTQNGPRTLFIHKLYNEWRISDATTGRWVYKGSNQEYALTRLVDDLRKDGGRNILQTIHNHEPLQPKLL